MKNKRFYRMLLSLAAVMLCMTAFPSLLMPEAQNRQNSRKPSSPRRPRLPLTLCLSHRREI